MLAVIAWLALSVLWLILEWREGPGAALLALPLVATILLGVWMLFGRPCVIVTAGGVELHNVLRDVRMPFGALKELSTRYCLKLTDTEGRSYQSWAAPAPSRYSTARVTEEDLRALSLSSSPPDAPSDSGLSAGSVGSAGASGVAASATLRSDAGAAAVAVRRAWREYLSSPGPGAGSASDRVVVTWNWPVIGGFVLLAAITTVVELL